MEWSPFEGVSRTSSKTGGLAWFLANYGALTAGSGSVASPLAPNGQEASVQADGWQLSTVRYRARDALEIPQSSKFYSMTCPQHFASMGLTGKCLEALEIRSSGSPRAAWAIARFVVASYFPYGGS